MGALGPYWGERLVANLRRLADPPLPPAAPNPPPGTVARVTGWLHPEIVMRDLMWRDPGLDDQLCEALGLGPRSPKLRVDVTARVLDEDVLEMTETLDRIPHLLRARAGSAPPSRRRSGHPA
jgi:hypothetical protein